ncbi:MAG: molybdopterin-dependent oxidoreductase [Chloroflexi bacterium]|nr:molybdopterin-dependent oxidoreductase [Chloroflexota bacterium]
MVKRGYLSGLAAALVSVGVMSLFRVGLGVPSIPEVLIDPVTAILPLSVFSFFIETLDVWAKPLLAAGLVMVQVTLGGVLGVLWLWGDGWLLHRVPVQQRGRRGGYAVWRWLYGLSFSTLLWTLALGTLLPVAEKGTLGGRSGPGLPLSWLASCIAYGMVLVGLSYGRQVQSPQPQPLSNMARRHFVQRLGLVSLGLVLAAGLGRYAWLVAVQSGRKATQLLDKLPPEVTPNGVFYTVSKNFFDPSLNPTTWKLTVDGLVERPLTLTYEELQAIPPVTQYLTLECISNEVGGDLMGNALWKGLPLSYLLEEAGVKTSARKVVLHADDGYSDSITLLDALQPGVLIAYEMNGVPLPDTHGFPSRLLVPGIYGMKNVKWLTRIELVDYDYQGYWQQRGWSDLAAINTMSRIDVPQWYRNYASGEIGQIGGIAFSGNRGISQVEVSTDDGKTWTGAQVKEALSPYTWVLWTKEWTPPGPGDYTLQVRAMDKTGALQLSEKMEPLPDGATGYHTIVVRIVEK